MDGKSTPQSPEVQAPVRRDRTGRYAQFALKARRRSADAADSVVTQFLVMAAAALTAAWTAFLIWLAVRLVAA